MGLFDKKYCSVCGSEIGLLGNRKLADGNLCKTCAGKLSPWFTGRKQSTVNEIKAQLQYREQNQLEVDKFNPTKIFGADTKVYIDENQGKFFVTDEENWHKANPDVLDISQLLTADLQIKEEKEERKMKDSSGKEVSYEPKLYTYTYLFKMLMKVNSPWFDEIEFDISDGEEATAVNDAIYQRNEYIGRSIQAALMPQSYLSPEEPTYNTNNASTYDPWKCECGTFNEAAFCSNCGKPRPVKWYCPKCGKENTGNFCISCGTKRPEGI